MELEELEEVLVLLLVELLVPELVERSCAFVRE
jgi:hypothetical protein